MSESPLQTLYRRYAEQGDLRALGAVFDALAPDLMRLARRMTRDGSAAEDVLQETFLTAVEHPEQFDTHRPVGPWLAGILVNRVRSRRRAEARTLDPSHIAERTSDDPSTVLQGVELDRAVRTAVAELPENERVAVAARLFDGVAPSELAPRLGISAGSARVRLHRGMQRLRAALPHALGAAVIARWTESRGLASVRDRVIAAADVAGGAKSAPAVAFGLLPIALLATAAISIAFAAHRRWTRPGPVEVPAETLADTRVAQDDERSDEIALTPVVHRTAVVTQATAHASKTRSEQASAEAQGGSFSGRVVDAEGRPIPDAIVRDWTGGDPRTLTTTDSVGRFKVEELGPGFVIAASKGGYASRVAFRGVVETGDNVRDLDLVLEPAGVLRGTVRDREGRPLEGVEVTSRFANGVTGDRYLTRYPNVTRTGGFPLRTTTDEVGRFEIGPVVRSSKSRLWFRKAPFLVQYADLAPRAGRHQIELDRGLSLEGIVLAADGSPAAGARVQGGPFWSNVQTTDRFVVTGDDGRFRLDGFQEPDPSDEYEAPPYLIVTCPGHAVEIVQPVEPSRTPNNMSTRVQLVDEKRIGGTVIDPQGSPVEGVQLRLIGDRRMRRGYESTYPASWVHVADLDVVETGRDGRFQFANLHEGEFELRMFDRDDSLRSLSRRVRAGDRDLEFHYDPRAFDKAILSGRVGDADTGSPITEFKLTPMRNDSGNVREIGSKDGTFELRGLDPGTYELIVRAKGYASRSLEEVQLDVGTNCIDVELTRSVSIPFRIVNERGELREIAVVHVLNQEGRKLSIDVGPQQRSTRLQVQNGKGVAHGLPAAQITFEVHSQRATERFAIDARQPIDGELEFVVPVAPPQPTGRLVLFVLEHAGGRDEEIQHLRTALARRDGEAVWKWIEGEDRPYPRRKVRVVLRRLDGPESAEGLLEPKPGGFACKAKTADGLDSHSAIARGTAKQWTAALPLLDWRLPAGRWSLEAIVDGNVVAKREFELQPQPVDVDEVFADYTELLVLTR